MKNKHIRMLRLGIYVGDILFLTALGSFTASVNNIYALLFLCAGNLLLGAFAFLFNDIEDSKDDSGSKSKRERNPFCSKEISATYGYLFCIIMVSLGLFFYSRISDATFLVGLSGFFVLFLYSFRPIRLKAVPFLDMVSHGFGHAIVLAIPIVGRDFDLRQIVMIFVIFSISALSNVKGQIRDNEIDRQNNVNNTASFIDLRKFEYLLKAPTLVLVLVLILLTLSYFTLFEFVISLVFALTVIMVYFAQWGSKNPYEYPHKNTIDIISAIFLFAFIFL